MPLGHSPGRRGGIMIQPVPWRWDQPAFYRFTFNIIFSNLDLANNKHINC